MKECWDCYYSESDTNSDKWICKKKGKKVEGDAVACSGFLPEDTKSCLECMYAEALVGGFFNRPGDYKCTLKDKKVHMDDVACSSFVED